MISRGCAKVGVSTGALLWVFPSVKETVDVASRVNSDYFELLLARKWIDDLDSVVSDFEPLWDRINTVHAFKATALVSSSDEIERERGKKLLRRSFEASLKIGADSLTCHLWDRLSTDSASHAPSIERIRAIVKQSQEWIRSGITLSVELLPAKNVRSIDFIRELTKDLETHGLANGVAFTLDLYFAALQGEMDSLITTPGTYNNVHVKDYNEKRKIDERGIVWYPELGEGNLDLPRILHRLAESPKEMLFTIESPYKDLEGIQNAVNMVRGFVKREEEYLNPKAKS